MPANTRHSGRKPDQMRPVSFELQASRYAEGSCLVSFGHTRVLVTATVEDHVPPFLRGKGQGWVTAEYGMLPRSTHSRMPREAAKGKQSGRTQEIQRLIGRSLRAAVDLKLLGEHSIVIDCDVLQADGGTRTAAITGAWVALAQAVEGLLAAGKLTENPLRGTVAAISCGLVKGVPVLDLDYEEDSQCDADVNFVMMGDGRLIEVQGTAEGEPFSDAELDALRALARKGVQELAQQQLAAVRGAAQATKRAVGA